MMIGDQFLWILRKLKNVKLPEGIKEIGDMWFMGSQIENITIPASVREIRNEAFRWCENLKCVIFAKGSRLEAVGDLCFADSGIQEINAPRSLRVIGEDVFARCKNMKGRWYVKYVCVDGMEIVVPRATFSYTSVGKAGEWDVTQQREETRANPYSGVTY